MSRRVGMEGRRMFCEVGAGERHTLLGSLRGERRVGRGLVGIVVGYGSLACVGLIALGLVFPVVGNGSTSALSCLDGDTTGCAVGAAETEAEVKVKTSIAVAMSSKVAMEVVPTSTGSSTIGSTSLSVSTNSVDGYALCMQASDGLTNTSTVHDGMVDVEKISIIDTPTSLSTMPNNRYGYYLGEEVASLETTFAVLPTTNSVIKRTTSMTSGAADANYGYGDTYNLSFGVKVGTELPAGTYSGAVTVSAVANPETVRSMSDLNYMQDMTSDICSRTREGYTKQLIDTRDGKSYWVAKLKDGNCWMVQNLAFTITQDMIDRGSINAGNTDIAFTWSNTPAWTDEASWIALGENYTAENYPGEYVGPSVTSTGLPGIDVESASAASTSSWNFGEVVQIYPDYVLSCYSLCTPWFTNVSSSEWQPTYAAQYGTYPSTDNGPESGIITADLDNKTYDAHYLVGNYYQFNTVAAGTGGALGKDAAVGSICPKGWRLSTSDSSFNDLQNLFDSYGLTGGLIANDDYSLLHEPLYIARAGFLHVSPSTNSAGLALVGHNGYIRGATILSSTASIGLDFQTSKNTKANMTKMMGMATRCLAR